MVEIEDIEDLFVVLKKEIKLPILTREQEREADKEKLVIYNLKLIVHVAKKHCGGNASKLMDLFQDGYFGLKKAADKFDIKFNCRFSTYAVWWIWQAMQRKLFNLERIISIKSHMPEVLGHFTKACEDLFQTLDRPPYPNEIAQKMGISEKKVIFLMNLSKKEISLDESPGDNQEFQSGSLMEYFQFEVDESSLEEDINRYELEKAIQNIINTFCDERERKVLMMRFGLRENEAQTLEEVGNSMNLSRERIRQIQKEALIKLKENNGVMETLLQFK